MNDYIAMLQEGDHSQVSPAEYAKLLETHMAFRKKLVETGIRRHSARLRPVDEGRRVSVEGVVDGPFAESKEALGGYYLFSAKNLDEAIALAKEMPRLAGDKIEVRQVMGMHAPAEPAGNVYAFVVLGKAKSEKQWSALMDEIDEKTQNAFPKDAFRGGFRLEAPSKGGATLDSRNHVLDGPFAEGKEVIGGVCFLTASSIDEATAWAKKSAFMKLGTLEIRQTWPT